MKKFLILFLVVFCFQIAKADNDAAWGIAFYFFPSFIYIIGLTIVFYSIVFFKKDILPRNSLFYLPFIIPIFQFIFNVIYFDGDFKLIQDLLLDKSFLNLKIVTIIYLIIFTPYFIIVFKIKN
jgi:hypothetical protein